MKIQLTEKWKGKPKGTILALPTDEAMRLVRSGVGVAPMQRTVPNNRMIGGHLQRVKRTEEI